MLRLKSCGITETWKGKHEQKCGNLFLHELFIGIFWITQINKMSFSFFFSYQELIDNSRDNCMKVKIIHYQSLTDWKTYQVPSNST